MKMYPRSGEKRRFDDIDVDDEEAIGALCRMSGGQPGDVGAMENEKRLRREIANSNERRRMQSINAGFNCLKQLLPHTDGEKLSKAAILQQTADYISQLEQDRKDLISQNEHLKKILQQQESTDGSSSDGEGQVSDLLSSIQDLHQSSPSGPATNLTSSGKFLATSEFHKLNNNTLSKNHNNNNNSSSIQLTSSKGGVIPQQQGGGGASPTRVVLDTKPLGAGGRVLLEDEEGVVTFRDDAKGFSLAAADGSTGYPAGHYRMEVDRSKRRRTSLEEKVKTLRRYPVIKNKLDCNSSDECVKSEPMEYSPVMFGLEDQVTKVVATGHSTVLQTSNGTRCYTISAPNTTTVHHPTSNTIVTILPPTPPHPNSMPSHPISLTAKQANKGVGSVLETVTSDGCRITEVCSSDVAARCSPRVEVELASRIPTPDEIEYSAGESPPHQQMNLHHDGDGYGGGGIVVTTNQSNNGCQKSLDTICEAIRHLEGDMFSGHDDTNAIEEEIITEETFPIQDTSSGQHHLHHDDGEATYSIHGSVSCASTIVRHTKEGVYEICASPSVPGPHSLQQQLQLYPSNGLVYGIDEHIVSSEPQEVPLELTTNHRLDRTDSPPPPSPRLASSHTQGALSSSNFIQASRPGVIVVKQA